LATLKSRNFNVNIDKFGRIAQVELLEDKYKNDEDNTLTLFQDGQVKPLEIRFADAKLNEEAFKVPYTLEGESVIDTTSSAQTIVLTQKLSSLTVTKKITIQPNGAYDLDVTTSSPAPYYITPGHRPMADTSMYMLVRGALVKGADDVVLTVEDGDAKGDEVVKNAKFASAFDRYAASMFYDFKKRAVFS